LNLAINSAVVLTDLGRYSEAEAVLSAAEENYPRAAEVSNQRGLLALRQGQVEQARADFELALSQRPEWDLPYLNLSYAFDQLHDFQRALDAARQAMKRSPRDPDASRRVVDLLLKEGRIAEALDALEQMTAAFPYDSLGWQNRIGLLRQIGRTTEADEVTRIAARYVPPERLR
jgi:tetratricopeptide (TPR) repeat protein